MNWKHIESTCLGQAIYTAEVDGKRIVSNGLIAFELAGEISLQGKPYENLGRLWAAQSALPVLPVAIGECSGQGQGIRRKVGDAFVAERFFRCFDGEGVTWTDPATAKDPHLVHFDGKLIAAVMRMSTTNADDCEPVCNQTDAEVFGPYACDENNWYLIDAKTLEVKIEKAERERRIAKDRMDELRFEIDECDSEIRSLRNRLKAVAA